MNMGETDGNSNTTSVIDQTQQYQHLETEVQSTPHQVGLCHQK